MRLTGAADNDQTAKMFQLVPFFHLASLLWLVPLKRHGPRLSGSDGQVKGNRLVGGEVNCRNMNARILSHHVDQFL